MRTRTTLFLSLLVASAAHAQTGVSDDRVSLPEGPGSLEGVGDNASAGGNRGSMQFAIDIDVPGGFPSVTPALALRYDSASGNEIAGMGWSFDVPFIERMTNLGLPRYGPDDRFVADGGTWLVQVEAGADARYRARFEGGFSRYTWHDVGDGTQGYWTEERADGSVAYYGADAGGRPIDAARALATDGAVFRYHLVEVRDVFGHRAEYGWRTYDGRPYLDRIDYTFTAGAAASGVRLVYGGRDDVIADARSGANERITRRLEAIEVYAGQTRMWRYGIEYAPYAEAGGFSRVRRVHRVGLDETPHPVSFDFEYSGGTAPYLVSMGSLGVGLAAGDATLVDLDGDALPDIVDTSRDGAHRVFLNDFRGADDHAFAAPFDSAEGTRAGHQLSSPYVQTLDANGDGRADLVNVRTGEVLFNLGTGDWSPAEDAGDVGALPDFGDDVQGAGTEPAHVRFFDYDNDRLIDVLRADQLVTEVYRNQGRAGFTLAEGVESIGAGFADQNLQLADMNGDGLQDPVLLRAGGLRYRINLGLGRWTAWREIEGLPFNEALIESVQLEDINGDSLDDIVLVLADELRYALNRNGDRFDPVQTVRDAGGQALPLRADGTTVLFADMNGSGSDDVVWITAAGEVTYLELFPRRPNLMTRITNGLGLVTEVEWQTSVEAMAASDTPWAYTLPFAMTMVERIDTWDALNAVQQSVEYRYADAFYDPDEKAFRGFATVERHIEGTDAQQGSLVRETYDVGLDEPALAGKLMASELFGVAGGALVPHVETTTAWGLCPLDGVPVAVRFPCREAREVVTRGDAPEEEWTRTRTTWRYDGEGNRIEQARLGIVAIGEAGCGPCDRPDGAYGEPCGAECLGDEHYVQTDYLPAESTGGRWLPGLAWRTRSGAEADHPGMFEQRFYYDGPDFEGLPAGEAIRGVLRRSTVVMADGTEQRAGRYAHDAHGNVITALGNRGAIDGYGHRTHTEFDAEALLPIRFTREQTAADGRPYQSVQSIEYDPTWGVPNRVSDWRTVLDGAEVTPASWSAVRYDDLGQIVARLQPGDPEDRPTYAFAYDYGAPVSRVTMAQRSTIGAALPDVHSVRCTDGLGRVTTSLVRLGADRVERTRHFVYDRQGQVVEERFAGLAESDGCALEPPADVPARHRYDARGRLLAQTLPDATIYGEASTIRQAHGPRTITIFDPLDTAAGAEPVPVERRFDGLGRVVEQIAHGAPARAYRFEYDVRGDLHRVTDPAGNVHAEHRDRRRRLVRVEHPDRGTIEYAYDADGNRIRTEDGEGRVTHAAYDDLSRVVARWSDDAPEASRVEFGYDLPDHCPEGWCAHAADRAVARRSPTASTWFDYDARGALVRRRDVVDGIELDTGFESDALNRPIAIDLPEGTRLDFIRDGLGRVVEIPGIAQIDIARGPLIDRIQYANGVTTRFEHDAMDRLARLTVQDAGTALLDLSYTRDRQGRILEIADHRPTDGPGHAASIRYDAQHRLVEAHLEPDRPAYGEQLEFAYDAMGNLTRRTSSRGAASQLHAPPFEYGEDAGPHALTGVGDARWWWDATGLLVDRDGDTLQWDAWRRLAAVETRDGARVEYGYDAMDQRVSTRAGAHVRQVFHPSLEIVDGVARVAVQAGGIVFATVESDTLAARALSDRAPLDAADGAIDVGDAVVAARAEAGELDIETSSTRRLLRASAALRLLGGERRTRFAHHNHRRDRVLETNEAGEVTARRTFAPFGAERSPDPAPRGRAGGVHDEATGLTRFGLRDFDDHVGRWIAPDPAFETLAIASLIQRPGEALNPYAFGQGDPINQVDTTGTLTSTETANAYGDLYRDACFPAVVALEAQQPDARATLAKAKTLLRTLRAESYQAFDDLQTALVVNYPAITNKTMGKYAVDVIQHRKRAADDPTSVALKKVLDNPKLNSNGAVFAMGDQVAAINRAIGHLAHYVAKLESAIQTAETQRRQQQQQQRRNAQQPANGAAAAARQVNRQQRPRANANADLRGAPNNANGGGNGGGGNGGARRQSASTSTSL